EKLQGELLPDETLLWAGRPCRKVILHKEDIGLIPFSLLWGGFAIFWEYMATGGFQRSDGPNWFFALWGVPFVAIGQYMIWGRFFYAWWKKGRVFYGVTNKRVIVLDRVWGRKVSIAYLDRIPRIEKECRSDGIGTLRFGYPPISVNKRKNFGSFDPLPTSEVPTFVDVEQADAVYRIVAEARDRLMTGHRDDSFTFAT